MKKIIIVMLCIVLMINMVSCLENVHAFENQTPTLTDTPSITTTVTIPDDGDSLCSLPRMFGFYTLSDYEAEIDKGNVPTNFIYYDQISMWGTFKSMSGYGDDLDNETEEYLYVLLQKEFPIYNVILTVDQSTDNWFTLDWEPNTNVLLENPSDDLRTCPYQEGETHYSFYNNAGITYKYFKGNLKTMYWMHNGIRYKLESDNNAGNFVAFPQWRTWISLFLNKQSADRAIEFFGLMLKGELPTIEEVFGPAYDEQGNPINYTPCEITWQKPVDSNPTE